MSKRTGGPAFPYSALQPDPELRQVAGTMYADNEGMTLRDYFAAQALSGICAARTEVNRHASEFEWAARSSYEFADALLIEREKDASS